MTHTITQTGLYAFDGVHVCHLAEGDTLTAHDRLPHHYELRETVLLTEAHLDALAADGWATTDEAPAAAAQTFEPEAAPAAPTPDEEKESETAEPEKGPEAEKAADPVTENKALDPVAETKPAAPIATKKPVAKAKPAKKR